MGVAGRLAREVGWVTHTPLRESKKTGREARKRDSSQSQAEGHARDRGSLNVTLTSGVSREEALSEDDYSIQERWDSWRGVREANLGHDVMPGRVLGLGDGEEGMGNHAWARGPLGACLKFSLVPSADLRHVTSISSNPPSHLDIVPEDEITSKKV